MTFREHKMLERTSQVVRGSGLRILVAALFLLLVLAIAGTPAPSIEKTFGGATVKIAADRAWVLLPGRCVTITWEIAEKLRVSVNNQDVDNMGEMGYCPSLRSISPDFEIVAANGDRETVVLDIRNFPSEIINCLIFLTIVILLVLALYFLMTERVNEPIPFGRVHLLALLALLMLCLLCQTGDLLRIEYLLDTLSRLFSSRAWQKFGLLLAGLVFTPLIFQALQGGLKQRMWEDFVAIGAFFLFLLMLYLPFGFDSVGHWEEWVFRAYLESEQSGVSPELVSRFWILVPPSLAILINSESFIGYNIVYFCLLWGNMVLLYGILRKLEFNYFFSFLPVVLFIVFPINSHFMSLRSLRISFNVLALQAAFYFLLDCSRSPSRMRMLRVWMALLFTVFTYEIAYAIILVLPLAWWCRRPRWSWRNINLTAIWYLFPGAKIVFLLLLATANRGYYGDNIVKNVIHSDRLGLESIGHYLDIVVNVYRQTFWYSWREALSDLSYGTLLMPTLAALGLVGIVAFYLAARSSTAAFPSRQQIGYFILSGFLFILPSIGVLMWIEKYNRDLWRMYVYAPIGAAIAVFWLLTLMLSSLRNIRLRKLILTGMCLLLMLPALSRLFNQHAHYVSSAKNKAIILRQVIEQAPAIDGDANLILLTEMLGVELRAKGISELRTGMLHSAIAVLYEHEGPNLTFVCIIDKRCFKDELGLPAFHLREDTDFSDLVIFYLHDDLSVELLRKLPPELGGPSNGSYKPDRLIDTSAPIPPRALTMLASARRAIANP